MRVCVINFSGNVGKTTIAANLLKPRLAAELFSVESLNQDATGDGVEAQRLRAQRFGELQRQVLQLESVVVDVGSSNVEMFLEMMKRYAGSHEDYDVFVIPTVKDRKQTVDTLNTIEALRSMGVGCDRIKVVFNRVDPDDELTEAFAPLFGLAVQEHLRLDARAVLHRNEVFDLIKDHDQCLAEVIADPTDHRALMAQETTAEGKEARLTRLTIKRLATTCARNMDQAFAALFPAHRLAAT